METDQCMDTQEDILTIILEEVRSMKSGLDRRLTSLERTVNTISYDLAEANANIRFLVNEYKNQGQRLTLQEGRQQQLPLRDSGTPPPASAALAVVKGGNDAE